VSHKTAPGGFSATHFFDSVVFLLGKLTNWTAYTYITPSSEVYDEVLRLVGIDPETTPHPLVGREGLYRRVTYGFRNQRREYCGVKRPAFCSNSAKGQWGLTALGVDRALELRSKFEPVQVLVAEVLAPPVELPVEQALVPLPETLTPEPEVLDHEEPLMVGPRPRGPNLTAKWVEKNYRPLYERLSTYLTRKMPVSAELLKVDDHIQEFFVNLIKRDGLKTRIEDGRSIPYSQVCAWAKRSAYSEIRDEGTEPVCRILHGALTKKEVQSGLFGSSNWTSTTHLQSASSMDGVLVHTGGGMTLELDNNDVMGQVADPHNFERDFLDEDAVTKTFEDLEDLLAEDLSEDKNIDWHVELLRDRWLLRMTVPEMAQKHGADRNHIVVALTRIRRAIGNHRPELEARFLP